MAPTVAIPSSGGKGESCATRAQGVELCSRATNLGVDTRPSPLVLQMGPVARDVCLAVGSDHFFWPDGIMEIPQALHDHFAPPALDSVYREVVRFLQLKRAAQTMGAHLVRFHLLRMGGSGPETFGSILRLRAAALLRAEKSLGLASPRGNSGAAAAARWTRRLRGPMGNAVRQDVLAATDLEEKAGGAPDDDDFEAWVASRKAEKNLTEWGRGREQERKVGKS